MAAQIASRQGLCWTSGFTFRNNRDVFWLGHSRRRPRKILADILRPCCSVKARWCIDIKYGVKLNAVALLQDWVTQIGSQAGLNLSKTQILSGAIGVPESRLVVSSCFANYTRQEALSLLVLRL